MIRIHDVLAAQGFTGFSVNGSMISCYFGGHIFRISQGEHSGVDISYVTSAYDNAVHHNDDIPVTRLSTMTFWQYLWDLGRILNRSLESITTPKRRGLGRAPRRGCASRTLVPA